MYRPTAHQTPQGAREGFPHAPPYPQHRAYASARPAALFPTNEVVALLSAIGAILGARLALFLSGLGVYLLGVQAVDGGSILPMLTFAGLVGIPLTLLSARRNI